MLTAEQETSSSFATADVIGDGVMRRIQRDLDLETMLLDTRDRSR